MTQVVAKSHTAVGLSAPLRASVGDIIEYAVSGSFVGTWNILATDNGGASYQVLATGTGVLSGKVPAAFGLDGVGQPVDIYTQCSAFTSGTIVTSIDIKEPVTTKSLLQSAFAKVGATAGWTAGTAAADTSLAALAASQTVATLIIPVTGLKVGDVITGFYLIGEGIFTGTGGILDCALRSQTAAAGAVTDALVSGMTQFVSASVNVAFNSGNTKKQLVEEKTVLEGESYYLLLTGTTPASNSMKIHGAVVNVR